MCVCGCGCVCVCVCVCLANGKVFLTNTDVYDVVGLRSLVDIDEGLRTYVAVAVDREAESLAITLWWSEGVRDSGDVREDGERVNYFCVWEEVDFFCGGGIVWRFFGVCLV